MARRRYISTDISTDKRIAKLAKDYGDFAALLYTWMVPHALDDCTITKDSEELLMLVTPGFRWKDASDIEAAVKGMLALDLLMEEEGGYYFPPDAFYRYQSYIQGRNRRTPQNAEDQRETPQITEERREMPQNAASPSPTPSLSPSPSLSVLLQPNTGEELLKDQAAADFAEYGTVTAGTPRSIDEDFEDFGAEWVALAVKRGRMSAHDGRPPWGYVHSILERWKANGGPDEPKYERQAGGFGRTNGKSPVSAGDRFAARLAGA